MPDTAVIPCGGLGTRLGPITRWIPKELLPVALRPLLFWALDEVAEAGLTRALIITRADKPLLEVAARSYRGSLDLVFVPQPQPRGLGDALLQAKDELGEAPFAVVLPDNLFAGSNPTIDVLAAHYRTGFATVLLAEVTRQDAISKGPTGRATTQPNPDGALMVTDIGERGVGHFDTSGAPSALTPIGRMVFPRGALQEFEATARHSPLDRDLDEVPVLRRYAKRDALVGVTTQARFFDAGVAEGYREAVVAYPARA